MSDESEPSAEELALITHMGRLNRAIEKGMSLTDAIDSITRPETAEEYAERNRSALEALEARVLSPEYMARFEAAHGHPDPKQRAILLAELKRETYATIDMEAFKRFISARNRQMKAEGMLPPDAPI